MPKSTIQTSPRCGIGAAILFLLSVKSSKRLSPYDAKIVVSQIIGPLRRRNGNKGKEFQPLHRREAIKTMKQL